MLKTLVSIVAIASIAAPLFAKSDQQLPLTARKHITLEPGEGAILFLGNQSSLNELATELKDQSETRDRTGALREMPFGVYIAAPLRYQEDLNALGITDVWKWYREMLAVLKKSGMNTVYLQGGGSISPEQGKPLQEIIKVYREAGIELIIQPDDVYFGGGAYGGWKKRTIAMKGDGADTSYQAFSSDYIKRVVTENLPRFENESGVLAWSPVEELPADHESAYSSYKALIRELMPEAKIYQLDSQQSTAEQLKAKRPPYPDIMGFDRYCWWHQEAGDAEDRTLYRLWTPHFAARWLFGVFNQYAQAIHEQFQKPIIAVIHGGAGYELFGGERPARYLWPTEEGEVDPYAPGVRYHADLALWGIPNQYYPPKHAQRLASWISICAGYKGVMLYGALGGKPDQLASFLRRSDLKSGSYLRFGSLHYDLTTAPQWDEFSDVAKVIQKYTRVILDWEFSPETVVATDEANVYINSFVDSKGRRFAVVVNGEIGEWDGGRNPDWIKYPESSFSVTPEGQLTGYTPLQESRKIRLKLPKGVNAYNLSTMTELN